MTYTDPPPKPDPDDDLFEVCPVARAFEIVGSKWRLATLRSLHLYGEQRFSDLQETTTADSATLSRILGDLEDQELITRRLEDRPIATYYDLTERGAALNDVFEEFEEWAFEYTAAEMPAVELPE
ncbi:winged helix-turn-helix transcriptional regulator [Haloarcula nitratireducens]|uniref:Helix-turn-helix transcriptional regulator n=1 Tax=Haloarcula nitratireducens TaxID=2487749 RepID=A0AAW4PJ75_9EURY|nr:helix-turn-helix domain-containing protein [Halomicroarcula nitratireducens]MBX0297445.1 helix-turn-helix transcriptional regulator [Halomicroarcula nitratireducens]